MRKNIIIFIITLFLTLFVSGFVSADTCGGKTTIENGQVLCNKCNLSKGAG